MTYAFAAAAA